MDAKRKQPVDPGLPGAQPNEPKPTAETVADNVMHIGDVRVATPATGTALPAPDDREIGTARGDAGQTDGSDPSASKIAPSRTPVWVLGARVLVPLLILAGGVATYQYLKATRAVQPAPAPTETRFVIQAAKVELTDVRPRLELFGTSVAGREVQLRALVAGRVIDTGANLRDGAVISRGDMLLRIDPFDYQSSIAETEAQKAEALARREELQASLVVERGNLSFAREQLAIAETDFRRAQQLAQRGNLASRSLDDRRLTVTQRQQSVTQLENNLKVVEARIKQQTAALQRLDNTLARGRQRLAETTLKAPFDAYVTDVSAQTGRMLSVNDPVATLIDRAALDVKFTLTDPQYGRLASSQTTLLGRPVEIVWDVGGVPVTYKATIDRVAARVASNAGGVEVFARVSNPEGANGAVPLRPGAFVNVRLDDILYEAVARIPATAIYDRDTVYVIEEGRMQARTVKVLGIDGDSVLIQGGVKPDDRVVTTRLSTPGTGVAVREQ